jgi:plastocyanin
MTRRIRIALVAATALLSLGATTAAEAATYHGYVNSSIVLRNASGNRVSRIPAGTHTFVIHDTSSAHNFTLRRGSRTLRATGTEFRGTRTWRGVRITRGSYTYLCTTHPRLRGTFSS